MGRVLTPKKALAACAAGFLTLAVPMPASADQPQRVVDEVFDADVVQVDPVLSEECGFPVSASLTGHTRETLFFDHNNSDSPSRITSHPSFRTTYTSSTSTVSTTDVGLDRFELTDDGLLAAFGTGVHLKLDNGTKAIGMWRLVFDLESGELVSAEYHGRFDVTADQTGAAICAALS
jgi:hypothetical protein